MGEMTIIHGEAIPSGHLDPKEGDEKVCQSRCQWNTKVKALVQVQARFFDRLVDRHPLVAQHKLAAFALSRWMLNQVADNLGNILAVDKVKATLRFQEA